MHIYEVVNHRDNTRVWCSSETKAAQAARSIAREHFAADISAWNQLGGITADKPKYMDYLPGHDHHPDIFEHSIKLLKSDFVRLLNEVTS